MGRVSTATGDPVTTAVVRRVVDGRESEFRAWADEGMAVVRRHPGFLGAGWLRSGTDDEEWHVVHRFADDASLQRWLDSPERTAWVERGTGTAHDAAWHRLSGVEGWFAPHGAGAPAAPVAAAPPPRWKQAVTIWLGFFPISLVLAVVVAPHLSGLDVVLRTLVTTVVTTPVMVYVVLPLVTRLVGGWLAGGRAGSGERGAR